MKQKIKYSSLLLSCLLFLLASCTEDEQSVVGGNLSIVGVTIEEANILAVRTKAIELPKVTLHVDILKDGKVFDNNSYTSEELPMKVKLATGNYTLEIYSDAYKAFGTDGSLGGAKYYHSEEFSIEDNKTTDLKTITLSMLNFGIALTLPEGFTDWFSDYSFIVKVGDKTKSLTSGQIAYFDFEDGTTTSFTYSLSATNQDGEALNSTGEYPKKDSGNEAQRSISANTVYSISYNLATKSIEIR